MLDCIVYTACRRLEIQEVIEHQHVHVTINDPFKHEFENKTGQYNAYNSRPVQSNCMRFSFVNQRLNTCTCMSPEKVRKGKSATFTAPSDRGILAVRKWRTQYDIPHSVRAKHHQ